MRTTSVIFALLLSAALCTGGCANHADVETIGQYGGYVTPQYGQALAELPPVAAVDFSITRRIIDDDDFATLFPALRRLSPRRICLGGQHITDKSIELLNQLPYLQSLNLEGSGVTYKGRGRLRLSHWD